LSVAKKNRIYATRLKHGGAKRSAVTDKLLQIS